MTNDMQAGSDPKNNDAVKEVFEGLFELLENLETQNVAILQFLKDNAGATDEKLKPYLDQAGNAASVKWRAHRARMEHLFSPIPQAAKDQKEAEKGNDKIKSESDKKDASAQERKPAVGTPNPITGAVSQPPDDSKAEEAEDKKESPAQEAASSATQADKTAKPVEQGETKKKLHEEQKVQTKSAS